MTSGRITPRSRRLRSLALLLLHLSVGIAAPLADAALEASSRRAEVHLESESRATCPPGHNHLLCPVCRHMEQRFVAAAPLYRPLTDETLRLPDQNAQAGNEHDAFLGRALGPRAPPLA